MDIFDNNNVSSSYKLMIFLSRYFNILIILIVTVLLLLIYNLFLESALNNIQQVSLVEIEQERKTYQEKLAYLARLKALKIEFDQISSRDLVKISNILPTGDQLPLLITQLEKLAQNSDMNLSSLSVSARDLSALNSSKKTNKEEQERESPDDVNVVNITINLGNANYAKVKKFLSLVERHVRLLDIGSIGFAGEIDSVTLTARAYYIDEFSGSN